LCDTLKKTKQTKLNNKKTNKLEFYEQKWFKLVCLFVFFGWLFYMIQTPFEIDKNELIELNVTVNKEWKSGGTKNPVKLYFTVNEYSNRFGIYVGGIYGRWTEVTETLEPNRKIKIKIHKKNKYNLNKETEVIPIYYLKNDKSEVIFNEDKFNEGEKSSDNRVIGFFTIIFILGLWKIITE
jgi:hypothetical protein